MPSSSVARTLGGPIKKDKLFYFVGYESFRESAHFLVRKPLRRCHTWQGTSLSIPDAIAAINASPPA